MTTRGELRSGKDLKEGNSTLETTPLLFPNHRKSVLDKSQGVTKLISSTNVRVRLTHASALYLSQREHLPVSQESGNHLKVSALEDLH